VLLIIFMVTAPIIQQGVEVSLPRVHAAPLPGKEQQFVISITARRRHLPERHQAEARRSHGQVAGDFA